MSQAEQPSPHGGQQEQSVIFNDGYEADTLDMTIPLRDYMRNAVGYASLGDIAESEENFGYAQKYLNGDAVQHAKILLERARIRYGYEYIVPALEDLAQATELLKDSEDDELKNYVSGLIVEISTILAVNADSWVLPKHPRYITGEGTAETLR